jgi:hypothetical protein
MNWHKVTGFVVIVVYCIKVETINPMNVIRTASRQSHQAVSNLYEIKKFNNQDSLYKFIATGDNSLNWKMREDMNLPSGHYKTQIDSRSIRYINVKTDKVYSFAR